MKLKAIFALILVFTLAGCATPGVKYYWGNYAETLYSLKSKPSDEAEQKHIDELLKIVSKSDDKGYRVPPGVQAELGYRYAQQGDAEKANGYFSAELAAYPESRLFIEKLQGMGSK